MEILCVEPAWQGFVHAPGNAGYAIAAALAYPEATLYYLGDAKQVGLLDQMIPKELMQRLKPMVWPVWEDDQQLGACHWRRFKAFQPYREAFKSADVVVLCSATASALDMLTWHGAAQKTVTFLHGNANDLVGWRSRNPLRKWLDFESAARRYVDAGGRFLVLEKRLVKNLAARVPWLERALEWFPHPILENELVPPGGMKPFGTPIHIGLAGNASRAKGFPEFIKLADALNARCPGCFAFHAIGFLPKESKDTDQSALATCASTTRLPREEYSSRLLGLDFMFQWHQDTYYELAASGVIYDAMATGIPLVARAGAEIQALEDSGAPIAISANDISALVETLSNLSQSQFAEIHRDLRVNLNLQRDLLSNENLAARFRELFAGRV